MLRLSKLHTSVCACAQENQDLFFKEVHDGVNVIAFGHIATIERPVCIIGGNCSIQAVRLKS
eukprot:1419984-Amphidinium_carterae.1